MRAPHVVLSAIGIFFCLGSARIQGESFSGFPEPPGQCSRLTPLVISEIMYHPARGADGRDLEFVELYNSGPTSEDLSGYRIAGDVDYTFPPGTRMASHAFLVVARNPAKLEAATGLRGVLGPFEADGALPDKQGTLRLRHRSGAIFLEVNYHSDPPWPVAADGAGHSLVLTRPSLGEDIAEAWSASYAFGGSPGASEPADRSLLNTVLVNEFLAHTDDPELDYIELFNASPKTVDVSGCVLTDDAATNRFIFPANTTIPPSGFLVFKQDALGFALSSAGETIYFKDPNGVRVIDAVRFEGQENGIATGRYPDGHREFYALQSKTPGQPNARVRLGAVVISEIMYHPPTGEEGQFVELYHGGGQPISLEGWRLEGGVTFTFPSGTLMRPDSYLVIAKDPARLRANHSNLNAESTLGGFESRLSGSGERIALTMPDLVVATNGTGVLETNVIHIVVDEVTYRDGGRWGKWADGGGSSLERVDLRADGRHASNWADSDESAKAPWTEISFTGRLDNGNVAADQLQVLLQGAGECLIDNVEVLDANGVNRIANSTFESNATGWTAEGTEDQSGWETSEGFNSSRSYRIRAVDRGDNQLNRVRVPLTSALPSFSTATIRAKVRWLRGRPDILFRLRGNWLEAAGSMTLPLNLGTPGVQNSRSVPNTGPALFDVSHLPVVPAAGAAVVVRARATDPDGLTAMQLRYRLDPGATYSTVAMHDDGLTGDAVASDGIYSGTIPGQTPGTLVAFYIEATDGSAQALSRTFPDAAPADEALVRFGEPTSSGSFPTYRLWMTQKTFGTWSSRNKLNNTPLPITFVLGDTRAIYGAKALYAGSPYIAPGYNTPSGRACGYSVSFPADDRFLGDTDLVLDWPGGHGNETTALQEQMAYWMADRMGLPYSYRYHIRLHVNGVTDLQRGTVFEAVNQPAGDFVDAWVPDDREGDFYKIDRAFEFSDGGSLTADPQPRLEDYTTTGGAKKTARYRWTWLKRSTQEVNNYTNVFRLVNALNATSPEPYTSQTEALIDLEEWMGILAAEHIIVNFDAYGHEIGKNMYSYKPEHGRWQLYLFDLDWLMLAAAGRRASYSASSAPLFNSEDPTMTRMYNHPPFRRAYFRAVQRAVDGPLVSANADPVMDEKYQSLLANGINRCDGQALTGPGVVKTWFAQRRTFLVNQLSQVAAPFAITSHGGADMTTTSNVVVLTGTAPIEVKNLRVNGTPYPVAWTSVNTWSLAIGVAPGMHELHLEGEGVDGTVLPGLTDSIRVTASSGGESPVGKVIFNEILSRPALPGAEFLELLNAASGTAFDLTGWTIPELEFTFPPGSVLEAGGYALVVKDRGAFMSAFGNRAPIMAEFPGTLPASGQTLSLRMPSTSGTFESLVDIISYESKAPWPQPAAGASLQLIDPAQDNFRVANWTVAAAGTAPPPASGWRYVSATGTASSSRLYIYMASAGDIYLDDMQLVAGEVAGVGANLIQDGEFESTFPGAWNVSANLADSAVSNMSHHRGNRSLHVVSSAPGSSQSTAIWQDLGPLVTDATYTLSYWHLPSTNGTGLTIRLSGSGISSTVNFTPSEPASVMATPGARNLGPSTLPPLPPVWINELLPDHANGPADSAGDRDPWVELYNAGSETVLLNNWSLTDNYSNLTQWTFPAGTQIAPKQFLLVWLDGEPAESIPNELHTSFRVPPSDGSLAIVMPLNGQPTVLDYVNYNGVASGQALALYPDGQAGARQVFTQTTPGQANTPEPALLPIRINEWMAANSLTIADPVDGQFEDWFELYNPNLRPVDLSGFWLADSLTNTAARWRVPAGTSIAAQGFLVVWADGEPEQNQTNGDVHADFRLSQEGEIIALFGPDGGLVDSIVFSEQVSDVSQGRSPDGSDQVITLPAATPGAGNQLSELRIEQLKFHQGQLLLTWGASPGKRYRILTAERIDAPIWAAIAEVVADTAPAAYTASPILESQRFFRIERVMP